MHWPRYVACSLCPREFYERALNWASDLIAERTYDVRKTCQLPIWGLERAKDAHRRGAQRLRDGGAISISGAV